MKVNRGDTGEGKGYIYQYLYSKYGNDWTKVKLTPQELAEILSSESFMQESINSDTYRQLNNKTEQEQQLNEALLKTLIQERLKEIELQKLKTKEKAIKQSGADFNKLKKEKVFEVIKRLLHEQGETEWFIDVSTTEFNLNGWAIENKEKLTEMYRCEFMNKEKFPRIEWKDRKPAIVPALGSRTLTKHQQRLREETRKID